MVNGNVSEIEEGGESPEESAIAKRTTIGILPMSDRVIIEQMLESEVSEGGIIIPDQSQEKPAIGTVVAIGEGKLITDGGYRIPCPYSIGHVVIFGKYAGTKFVKKFVVPNPILGQGESENDPGKHGFQFSAPDTCKCGESERHEDHVPEFVTTERTFLIMREDEIQGIDLDAGKPRMA